MAESAMQEHHDRLYFQNGPCCAGCDWWRSISSQVGDCTRSAPVDGQSRWDMLGISSASIVPAAGHVVTKAGHVCGDFADTFDWSTLPLPYRRRVGAPMTVTSG